MPTLKKFTGAGRWSRVALCAGALALFPAADLPAAPAPAADDAPAQKSVLSPEKAGKAEGAAADYARKAVICEWLAGKHAANPDASYAALQELSQAAAEQKWRVWQAHHFDDADLLKQAETACKPLAKQVGEREKALKAAGLPRPDLKALAAACEGNPDRAGQIADSERAAMNCARQSHVHAFHAERRIDSQQPYHAAMAEGYAALAWQHWQVWRACHLNDIDTMVKAQANVRILQQRLDNRRQGGQPQAVRRLDSGLITASETLAVNHGMLAVKCGQMAVQADGELKKIYLNLAENYRDSSQLRRKIANAAAGMDERAAAALKIKILKLRDARKLLWESEEKALDELKTDPEQAELRHKIAEFKREYQALRKQVENLKDLD